MNLSKKYPALFRLCKGAGARVVILYFLISLLVFYQFSEHFFNYSSNLTKFSFTKAPTTTFEPKPSFTVPNVTMARMKSSPDPNHSLRLACRMPQLEPFSQPAKAYLKTINVEDEKKTNCEKIYPKLFESTLDGNIVAVGGAKFKSFGYRSCCYKRFQGGKTWGYSIEMSPTCHPLSLQNETKIPQGYEFVEISCEKRGTFTVANETVDFHSFIRIKPEVEEKLNKVLRLDKSHVNVIVFGIDSTSRMSFHRFMPKSLAYLQELEAVEMTGYNKVGDNTYPCIIPLLTNRHLSEASHSCARRRFYDDCPFIWKSYEEKGYHTSFAEDNSNLALFGGGGPVWGGRSPYSFEKSPTHYDFKPYAYQAQERKFPALCYGPRLGFKVLLDNVKKLVYQMDKIGKPYFHFSWASELTHSLFTGGKYGDEHVLELLKWMKNSGSLNQTVFILMGDHGYRFGEFRNTYEGQQEQRLPLLFLILPDWMKSGNYSRAFKNLLMNRDRLMTVFDLHQVFLDILNLEGIENDNITQREAELFKAHYPPRGISLFLPIPKKRTCEMADIPRQYCACKRLSNIASNSSAATKAALASVEEINSIISNSSHCSNLSLSSVIKAGYDEKGQSYEVNFQTEPGNATFEAIVDTSGNGRWKAGTIIRTNSYRNQSYCVHDRFLKSYCYCI